MKKLFLMSFTVFLVSTISIIWYVCKTANAESFSFNYPLVLTELKTPTDVVVYGEGNMRVCSELTSDEMPATDLTSGDLPPYNRTID